LILYSSSRRRQFLTAPRPERRALGRNGSAQPDIEFLDYRIAMQAILDPE